MTSAAHAPHRLSVLVIPDCPNASAAIELAAELVRDLDLTADLELVIVETEDEAVKCGFVGSPSFYVNGADVLPAAGGSPGMACRVYPTPEGRMAGLPTRHALAEALVWALA